MNRLNQIIKESGFKLNFIASKLGITYVGLHNKLSGKCKFTIKEALILKNILEIEDSEWEAIFAND